ncbi:hypothetical protein K7432_005706 [Basidiobolus ranarum]|uniref:Protein Zds1 C-terminal domain-containing protein n=1 Tax=Basidiobolus ranarum TaxID=34480 RepID=A0ABR2W2Q5_9FUNG
MVDYDSPLSPEMEEANIEGQIKPRDMVEYKSTFSQHIFEPSIEKESFPLSNNNQVNLSETMLTSANNSLEMECVNPNSLTDWALSENPSHLFWVPAHLHPEIAPYQFKAWLHKHSSAVNHTETTLTRRKSILSLHSYSGSDFASELTADGKKSTKPSLNPSNLRRQLTVTTGMKIPRHKDEADSERSAFNAPFLIQSIDLRPSLKRSARTKVRRNSVKSTESRVHIIKPSLRKSKSVEGDISQTKDKDSDKGSSPEEGSSPEATPQESESEMSPESPVDDTSDIPMELERNSSEDLSPSKNLPPRKDSLPILQNLDTSTPIIAEKSETIEKQPVLGSSKKKNSSWSWFWGAEPSDTPAQKVTKSKKLEKSRPSSPEDMSGKVEEEETVKKKSTKKKKVPSDSSKKQGSSDTEIEPTSKEHIQSNNDQKIKKPYSPILTFFSKSKNKNNLNSQENGNSISDVSPIKLETISTKPRYTNYSRLPIHIERGIYRLSHIKLTNPRRPLLHQVLISNMMFWYLSVVSKQSSDPSIAEDRSSKEAMFVKSKVGKTPGGRRRAKRPSLNNSDGISNGKKSEMAVQSPQYRQQHQRIHNGDKSVMLKHAADTTRHQLAKSRSTFSDSSSDTDSDTNQDTHIKCEVDEQSHNDDDDDLPLAIYKGNLANTSP